MIKMRTIRKTIAGLATESDPSKVFIAGILVKGSESTNKYQITFSNL
jgi:hypothetical protein